MKTLDQLFEEKKIENEFQNREAPSYGEENSQEAMLKEIQGIRKRLNDLNFQALQLENRLRNIQKYYYDDMTIIDNEYKTYDGEVFPWNSSNEYTKSKYAEWPLNTQHLRLTTPILQVAIRIEGHKDNVKILNNICRRIMNIDSMAEKLLYRDKTLKNELNNRYGKFIIDTDTNSD